MDSEAPIPPAWFAWCVAPAADSLGQNGASYRTVEPKWLRISVVAIVVVVAAVVVVVVMLVLVLGDLLMLSLSGGFAAAAVVVVVDVFLSFARSVNFTGS